QTATFDAGDVTAILDVPILPDATIEGNETVTVSVAPGTGYAVGPNNTAVGDLIDDDFPAETVLYEDNFNDPSKEGDWAIRFGSANPETQDYVVFYGRDYSDPGLTTETSPTIPPAPHSNGDTHGLMVSVNKGGPAQAAGVNLYPIGKNFSGNYALRFDMYLMQVAVAPRTTEHALFGINHSGTETNWFSQNTPGVPTGWTFDGIWAGVIADGSGFIDYGLF